MYRKKIITSNIFVMSAKKNLDEKLLCLCPYSLVFVNFPDRIESKEAMVIYAIIDLYLASFLYL